MCAAVTPFSASVAGMPTSRLRRPSQATKSPAVAPAPQTRASSAIFSAAASALKRITWSIMMPLASPWCMSTTVPSACAQECTAPRSFWKAMAPIIEDIIMSARAARLPGSRTAVASARAAMREPSSAMPSHSGW